MRTLAELAKEGANATAESDMVDAVVRSGAVEAIVPLLSLSQRVREEFDVSFGDIEKEASYAISLMASRGANQNRIAGPRAPRSSRCCSGTAADHGLGADELRAARGGRGDQPRAREQRHQNRVAWRGIRRSYRSWRRRTRR